MQIRSMMKFPTDEVSQIPPWTLLDIKAKRWLNDEQGEHRQQRVGASNRIMLDKCCPTIHRL